MMILRQKLQELQNRENIELPFLIDHLKGVKGVHNRVKRHFLLVLADLGLENVVDLREELLRLRVGRDEAVDLVLDLHRPFAK